MYILFCSIQCSPWKKGIDDDDDGNYDDSNNNGNDRNDDVMVITVYTSGVICFSDMLLTKSYIHVNRQLGYFGCKYHLASWRQTWGYKLSTAKNTSQRKTFSAVYCFNASGCACRLKKLVCSVILYCIWLYLVIFIFWCYI